jgi:pyridoxal 5'-phosphate synthase pdxS subunit
VLELERQLGTEMVKRGMAQMQKGGVIMDVVNAEQARIAEASGAVAVMALERVPSDIRAAGGVARMADPRIVEEVMNAVTIPVMAKARIGHIVEARVLEAMGVDYIDESEVLTPADEEFHLLKSDFTVPFVCGCRDLGEAARRIGEGASMLRTKGEPGTGNIVEAVRHMRKVQAQVRKVTLMSDDELMTEAKNLGAPYEILKQIKAAGKLPVVNFAAGGVATPADAALMMELGADGVFVGSGIFKSESPEKFASAIVQATTYYNNYELIGKLSKELGTPMKGIEISKLNQEERMQERGW